MHVMWNTFVFAGNLYRVVVYFVISQHPNISVLFMETLLKSCIFIYKEQNVNTKGPCSSFFPLLFSFHGNPDSLNV